MKRLFSIAGALAIALAIFYARAQVTNDVLTWTNATTRSDGSPLAASEILQTRISWGTARGGPYTAGTTTVAGNLETWTRSPRPSGRACYVATHIDTAGLESANSAETCTEKCPLGQRVNAAGSCVLLAPPSRPTNVQAQ